MNRRSDRARVYRTALCALLLAMMLILGYVESMIPLNAGIPGIKLGLSNGVLIFAVYMLDIPAAFVLMVMKVLLSGMLFAGPSAMMYGLAGGTLSLTCMALLSRIRRIPVPAVSIVGGVMHNVGQIALSLVILRVPAVSMLGYLLVLMAVGAVCGLLTGVCARSVMAHLRRTAWKKPAVPRRRVLPWVVMAAVLIGAAAACWMLSGQPTAHEPVVEWICDVPPVEGLPILPRQ